MSRYRCWWQACQHTKVDGRSPTFSPLSILSDSVQLAACGCYSAAFYPLEAHAVSFRILWLGVSKHATTHLFKSADTEYSAVRLDSLIDRPDDGITKLTTSYYATQYYPCSSLDFDAKFWRRCGLLSKFFDLSLIDVLLSIKPSFLYISWAHKRAKVKYWRTSYTIYSGYTPGIY